MTDNMFHRRSWDRIYGEDVCYIIRDLFYVCEDVLYIIGEACIWEYEIKNIEID